ncbi:class I SAM-dependent methyltransferase [Paenibacillus sp. NFR01]|uniref:class I SAM-dependent methyltransferase n=1 Tax=Paenibacillus sp. NFR01 TaxID=1566279 RepID=UPI0008CA0515|nr:class I SAM-dependent methyltransferase [Paenibacillus sp. NFR01]SET94201.1 Methyltransferase domain-containing protein [Paenibacillus sp. NFR01]
MSIHEKIKQWERTQGVALFADLGLPDNANILDYGCGYGHFTFAASRYLGSERGNVFAVDINRDCLTYVNKVAQEEGLSNVNVMTGNKDYILNFEDNTLDMILYYDILHGNGSHRFTLLDEAKRTLKHGGILSILPFHLSNFRDREGKKKVFTYKKLIEEVNEYGFIGMSEMPEGVHFEKYHSSYYNNKGGVEFEDLERAGILNFRKNT